MKLILAILTTAMLCVTNLVTAQNKTITATVVNITSDSGKVGFALYDKTNYRMKPIQSANAIIEAGKSTVVFENVEGGEYAIICYHDKNDNDKMDFKANGMPLEDYGASNNNMTFGPPRFEHAKFKVNDKNVSLEIKF
ncbi:DUF2141 domain-containing protein [Polaribacter sp. HaHaR_3_91]|uniref:DUF2141 domain-containing protein n=1 Tax=Polaribacter sp. HaHaR_3_91 TaxID=2745561 RepID=UPI001C4F8780|nr:DUF2141 domain-containing protein [Polaribacter sp. HaHaR_3_91]QXP62422.1 DUF2141 domain-containing protein [Polaribacter sp. HaHaR_3_91]